MLRALPPRITVAIAFWAAACGASRQAPSDDPSDYDAQVDPAREYTVTASEPRWVVPSPALPAEATPLASNNNVDIHFFGDRLFFAWRTNDTHFASRNARMHVVSSKDEGRTWSHEHTVALGADVREPRLWSFGGALHLAFFEAGTDMFAFEPRKMWRTTRRAARDWGALVAWGDEGEIPWCLKVRGGQAFLTTYIGEHYGMGLSRIDVRFLRAADGISFVPVRTGMPVVYRGGVSEVAFEFDRDGSLWAVTRNEDGDESGFGSHVCFAPANDLGTWDCGARSSPERYDSPAMFRHGSELYLIARRDVGGPFDQMRTELPFADQKRNNLLAYSSRPKRTALYRIDKSARRVVHVFDLPGAGDTAFPSVRRTGPHTFLVANYTSPLSDPDRPWLVGQTSADGTQIYLLTLTFTPR